MSEDKKPNGAMIAGAWVVLLGIVGPLALASIAGAWWLCIFSIKALCGLFS